nr:beta-galactosidase [Quercus suber]
MLCAYLLALITSSAAAVYPHRRQATQYAVQTPPLDTDWTYKVGTDPWPEYPRPQLQRSQWQSLNGIWTYENASSLDAVNSPPLNQSLTSEVLIPSCLESGLSGIQTLGNLYSWFSTSFFVPSSWGGGRVLLNFGAVDYEATVFINGNRAGFHRGGYFSFTVDVTNYLRSGENRLYVDKNFTMEIAANRYTTIDCGIWQQVWIESAPAEYITDLHLNAGADGLVSIVDRKSKDTVATHDCRSGSACTFSVSSPNLWTPDSPNLYDVNVQLGDDSIKSYTGFRTISRGLVNGVERPLLNGEFIFLFGTLDQGFWPDGLYTPPNYEAMVYDIKTLKSLGFNMLRKHVRHMMSLIAETQFLILL